MSDEPAGRNGKLKIDLPFDEAVKAALETAPEPEEAKPFGKKRPTARPDRPLRSKEK